MNIDQAKQIPLEKLVYQLGGKFSHKGTGNDSWYFSPFRPDEHTASFKVDCKTNKWHDFARTNKLDAHGDIIDLWIDFNNLQRRDKEAIKQALKALEQQFSNFTNISTQKNSTSRKPAHAVVKSPRYILKKQPGKIWIDSLKKAIAARNLSLDVVSPFLKQAHVEDTKTKKQYYGFAFENDKKGYEISIPNPYKKSSYKTVIGAKAITSIENPSQTSAYVFEGFWDMLTWIAMNKKLDELPSLYVLNSTSMVNELANKLITYQNTIQSIFLFMDNDDAGRKAEQQLLELLEPFPFTIGTKNHLYVGYKDLNEMRVKKLKL